MSDKKERIVLDVAYQPQVRTATDTRRLMLDVIIALMPAVVVAAIQFGVHAMVVILSSIASAVFWEWLYRKLFKKEASIGDLSACYGSASCADTASHGSLVAAGCRYALRHYHCQAALRRHRQELPEPRSGRPRLPAFQLRHPDVELVCTQRAVQGCGRHNDGNSACQPLQLVHAGILQLQDPLPRNGSRLHR